MKKYFFVFVYLFFTINAVFCMEDVDRYYNDFQKYNRLAWDIYKKSKIFEHIPDQLIIAQKILTFVDLQINKSAYNDAQLFEDYYNDLKTAFKKINNQIKQKNVCKDASLQKKAYYIENCTDEDEEDIDDNSWKDQLLIVKEKINNFKEQQHNLDKFMQLIKTDLNKLEKLQNIQLPKEVHRLYSKASKCSFFDKITYIKHLLTAVDANILSLKDNKSIEPSLLDQLIKRFVLHSNSFEEITKSCSNNEPLILKTRNIFNEERAQKVKFEELCNNQKKEHENDFFISSWSDFCVWQKLEEKKYSEKKQNKFETQVHNYIDQKIQYLNKFKSDIFMSSADFVRATHEKIPFNVSLLNNLDDSLERFSIYANLILSLHEKTLLTLSFNEQNMYIEHMLKTVSLFFLHDYNFNDIATLSFDTLLFLGDVFYAHNKNNDEILLNGYFIDYIHTKDQKNKLITIHDHVNQYTTLKNELFSQQNNITLTESLIVHSLTRIFFQGLCTQDYNAIKSIIQNSSQKDYLNTLASIYGFCRFLNEEAFNQSDIFRSFDRIIPYFDDWHKRFTKDLDEGFDFKDAVSGSIEALLLKDVFVSKFFKNVFNTKVDYKKVAHQDVENDDVLRNPIYGGGIGWTNINNQNNQSQKKKSIYYNESLVQYVLYAYNKHRMIYENRSIKPEQFWQEARKLWDIRKAKELSDLINKKTEKQYALKQQAEGLTISFETFLNKLHTFNKFKKIYNLMQQSYTFWNKSEEVSASDLIERAKKISISLETFWDKIKELSYLEKLEKPELITDLIKRAEKISRSFKAFWDKSNGLSDLDKIKDLSYLIKQADELSNVKKVKELSYLINEKRIEASPENIFSAYATLMTEWLAYPYLFTENTQLPEFAKKYQEACTALQRLEGVQHTHNEALDLVFINWWAPLYKPADGQTFADYIAIKKDLMEKAKELNNYQWHLGSECRPFYLMKYYLTLGKKMAFGLMDYEKGFELLGGKKENRQQDTKNNYVFFAVRSMHDPASFKGLSNYYKEQIFR